MYLLFGSLQELSIIPHYGSLKTSNPKYIVLDKPLFLIDKTGMIIMSI